VLIWIILGSPLAIASLPRRTGTVAVAGGTLSAPVHITRDAHGVPSIQAASRNDAYFAQGYVHAQDRFFQMELARRTGNGELAALFGERALDSDIYFRTLGIARVAEAEYEQSEPWARAALESYAAGVNAYVSSRPLWRLGYEFLLLAALGNRPAVAPWTPADSLVWGKVVGATLAVNYEEELLRLEIESHVGPEKTDALFPDPLAAGFPSTVREEDLPVDLRSRRTAGDSGAALAAVPLSGVRRSRTPPAGADPASSPPVDADLAGVHLLARGWSPLARVVAGGVGSNAWVVSGEHTASGLPILANDPHLAVQIPSQFYEVELVYQTADAPVRVRGHSFPGVPGIVIGRNDRVAWGMTTAYVDEQDLFVEEIGVDDASLYRAGDEWHEIAERTELIAVARQTPVELQVRSTRNGPLIGGIAPDSGHASALVTNPDSEAALHEVALGWTALEPGGAFSSMVRLTEARSASAIREALRDWTGPAHNVIYADAEGTVGYQLAASIPDRRGRSGNIPVAGWVDENRWNGTVEFDSLPHAENPARGYLVSANNAWAPAETAVTLGTSYLPGYRALRIEELLSQSISDGLVDAATMQAIQLDVHGTFAERLITYVRELELLPDAESDAAAAREMLVDWDGEMTPGSAGAALFARFLVHLVFATMEDEFPADAWNEGAIIAPQARIMLALEGLLATPRSDWWDDKTTSPFVEQRDQVLTASLEGAWRYLRQEIGHNPETWSWGAVHGLEFPHVGFGSSGSWLLHRLFNRGPFVTPGGMNQVNRNAVTLADPDAVEVASAFRMIVDLADPRATLTTVPTGQSGHIASRFYDSETADWIAGRYRATSGQDAERSWTLILEPAME
jgi:penicillin amidase